MHKKKGLRNALAVKWNIFICFLTFGSILIPGLFYTWNFGTILRDRFLFYQKFITIYIYKPAIYLACIDILDTSLCLNKPYIFVFTICFYVCNNILVSVLIRDAFSTPLLLFSSNTEIVIGTTFCTNIFEVLIDRNASTIFLKPWILSSYSELNCSIFLFSCHPQLLF